MATLTTSRGIEFAGARCDFVEDEDEVGDVGAADEETTRLEEPGLAISEEGGFRSGFAVGEPGVQVLEREAIVRGVRVGENASGGGLGDVSAVLADGLEDRGETGLELSSVETISKEIKTESEAVLGVDIAAKGGEAGGELGRVDASVSIRVEEVEGSGDDGLERRVEPGERRVEFVAREP